MVVYLLTCAEALQAMVWQYEVCLYYYTIASLAVVISLAQIKTMHGVSFVVSFVVVSSPPGKLGVARQWAQ